MITEYQNPERISATIGGSGILGLITQIPFGIFIGFTAKELYHYPTWKEFLNIGSIGSMIE
ncbi:hypothetical protein [Leptospira jelokensis]|uniref:hypothetical protein n=1 Tax=Leptospira jelokensis TaxID=2484931 RepID=UPI0010912179|nr:hypothetical protein [Leptospira jelokensis]TGM06629.1 hypothetical protein EHQ79_01330 [Leptospira jelokensis]